MKALIVTNYDIDFSKSLEKKLIEEFESNSTPYEIIDYKNIDKIKKYDDGEYIMFTLGGDGTLLGSLRYSADLQIPAVGINSGRKGFLIEIGKNEIKQALRSICRGKYNVQDRIILTAKIYSKNGDVLKDDIIAVNDFAVSRQGHARVIHLGLKIDSGYEDSFDADGVLVSTPMGSTAYSLSAGGPIVMPEVNCMLITPICAHSLHTRPVVVSDGAEVKILVQDRDDDVIVTSDGQSCYGLPNGGYIIVGKYFRCAKLVSMDYNGYYKRFKEKMLNWAKS